VTAEQVRREFDADVVWLPFMLHPEYPPEGIPLEDLHRRYGIGTGDADPLRARFAEAGLQYDRPDVVPNTRAALRVTELARELDVHDAFHDRLMDAYWAEATNIGEHGELRRLAAEVGLPADEVERVLADPEAYAELVDGSTQQAQSIGITGIPGFLLDRRLLILGAQPLEAFRRAFAQLADA
jgi:predicted DsbA family dithiol-disulfide isomerase